MFQIHIKNAVFAQSAKYLIIAKNDIETKRSQVCSNWTSAPIFRQSILVDTLDNLSIKACIATTDKKLSVIGRFTIENHELNNRETVIYQEQRNFNQNIQGKEVCVGRCTVIITQKSAIQELKKAEEQVQLNDQLEFKSESSEDESNSENYRCQVKFIIHCGFDFYLNEGFRVGIKWGSQSKETRTISNKLSPFWGQYIKIRGNENKIGELLVKDSKNNKLQWMRFDPKSLRIMSPYHLHLKFRQEYMGAFPNIYVTIIREDVPLLSILDKQIRIGIKYVGSSMTNRRHEYLLIYRREVEDDQNSRLPIFIDLDMKDYVSFENINHMIENSKIKDYQWNHWNILLPIKSQNTIINKQEIGLLKSTFSQSLVCLYFCLEDPKLLFQNNLWNAVTILYRKPNFENSIKQIYYNQRKVLLAKTIELSSGQIEGQQNSDEAISDEQKWRILSQNYLLRKKMLDNSGNSISTLKQQIRQKGEYLVELKKVLGEVHKMNKVMVEKQKSAFVVDKNVKMRENFEKYDLMEIITTLFTKHEELDQRKKINDEMRMRMNSLQHFNEDSEEVDNQLVANSEKLLGQQQLLKEMASMKKAIPKQAQVIRRLEKIFEQREVDREMNQLLQKQHQKLNMIKREKRQNLQNVYKIIKQRNSGGNSLLQSISNAERELMKLSAEYAQLGTYS